jgi:hypothetical protein
VEDTLSNDRIPIPLQAVWAAFVPVMFAAAFQVVWIIATWSEPAPGESRSAWLLVIPAVMAAACALAQHRSIRRSVAAGMIDRASSPMVVTAWTLLGAVTGTLLTMYLPGGGAAPRNAFNRNSMSFPAFAGLAAVWLSAWLGLAAGRSRGRSHDPGSSTKS